MSLSKRVKSLRDARGWTQEDLAKELSVSVRTVARWEDANFVPRKSVVTRIENLERATQTAVEPSPLRHTMMRGVLRGAVEALATEVRVSPEALAQSLKQLIKLIETNNLQMSDVEKYL
jgi:transcriptional regulator with XRE-family HTH domain